MGSSLDELTRALYARKKPLSKEPENALLKCPKCPNRLRPLLLDVYEEDGKKFQRIWWTCRGLKAKKCMFPLMMPPDVFWTKRTEDQMRQDVIPLPNFNLLPKEYWKMYPTLFKPKRVQQPKRNPPVDDVVQPHLPINTEPNTSKEKTNGNSGETNDVTVVEDDTFEGLKKREESRKRKSRATIAKDMEGNSPVRKTLTGVTISQSNLQKIEPDILRKPLPMGAAEERIVAGGRNFDIKVVDELTSKSSGKMSFSDDVHTSLKAALALRFARNEVLDRITGIMSQKSPQFQTDSINNYDKKEFMKKVSEQVAMESKPVFESDNSDLDMDVKFIPRSNEDDFAKKTIQSYRQMEMTSILSRRLSIKVEELDPSTPKRPRLSTSMMDYFPKKQLPSTSTATNASSSTPSFDSNSESRLDVSTQEFNSPELNSLVQRHLQTLKAKVKKNKRRSRKKQDDTSQQPINFNNDPIDSYIDNNMYHDVEYDHAHPLEPVSGTMFDEEDFDFGNYDIYDVGF